LLNKQKGKVQNFIINGDSVVIIQVQRVGYVMDFVLGLKHIFVFGAKKLNMALAMEQLLLVILVT